LEYLRNITPLLLTKSFPPFFSKGYLIMLAIGHGSDIMYLSDTCDECSSISII